MFADLMDNVPSIITDKLAYVSVYFLENFIFKLIIIVHMILLSLKNASVKFDAYQRVKGRWFYAQAVWGHRTCCVHWLPQSGKSG